MVWVVAAVWVAYTPQREAFEAVRFSHAWADALFRGWTWLGHGMVLVLVLGWVGWRRQQHWRWVLCSVVLFALTNVLLKRVVFKHSPRPAAYAVEWGVEIRSPVVLHHWHAMPSGHTGTAFTAATIVALLSRRRGEGILSYLLAAGVGYSRVYLGQHFPADVVVGAFIGTVIPLMCYQWKGRKVV